MANQDYASELATQQTPFDCIIYQPRVRSWTYRGHGKQLLDVFFVLLLMPVLLPLIGILALLVARDGHAPFYVQERVGKGGRPFRMWKLRTMVPDADAKLQAHLAMSETARAEWEVKQKLSDDPRVTDIGHFLRRTSLDELPQFFNVLAGDMSVVGPRPMMVGQENLYPGTSYFALRPGVTGPWQVAERNESAFADRARFDDDYYGDVSVGTDLGLIARTVIVVLHGTGS